MGAATVAKLAEIDVDGQRVVVATLVPSASYGTGGETVALGSLGLTRVTAAVLASNTGYVGAWDNANSKVQVFRQSAATSALTELNSTGDASGTTFTGIFFGI